MTASHLHGILEILDCDPKGRRALLRVPSTVGRSVCLCWEHSKPKGPKKLLAYVGLSQNLKGLKAAGPVYGRARCVPMLGAFIT